MRSPKSDMRRNYVVLQGYMVQDMELSGAELMAYAIIFGFCQAGRECDCSLRYFQFWLGCSKSTAIRVLDSLEARDLIVRARKTVNGVPFTSYSLGRAAFEFTPDKPILMGKPQVDGWCQNDTTSVTPTPAENDAEEKPSSGGSVNLTLLGSNLDPIYKTDTDTESESVSVSESVGEKDRAVEDERRRSFAALKAVMPNTDGASYGFGAYCALLDAGYGAEDIHRAMVKVTEALRADYPERPARYFPHAERLLDPGNPNGVARFLSGSLHAAAPTDGKLFVFALTRGPREFAIAAERLNNDFTNAASLDERNQAVEARRAWVEEHREELIELWDRAAASRRRS